jgi:hypothetical protein
MAAAPASMAAGQPPLPPRPALPPRQPGPGVLETRAPHGRPDPNPLRLLYAFAGIASASAIATALLPSVVPAAALGGGTIMVDTTAQGPAPSVLHATQYVTLKPGQTAPPNAPIVVQPTPTPRVRVVTRTRQSGLP